MLKVLIADDEMIICQMLKKLIHWEEKGLSVEGIATNGIELYEMMKSVRPDIVITDIRMPGYDGLQIVKKGISLGLSADYIIMSGYKNFEYAHTALNLGVKHYLLKPIDAKELNDTLDQILKERNFLENAKKENRRRRPSPEAENIRSDSIFSILLWSRCLMLMIVRLLFRKIVNLLTDVF